MTELRIPQPSDFDLTAGDLALVVKNTRNYQQALGTLIERFHITEKVARAWLEALKHSEAKT